MNHSQNSQSQVALPPLAVIKGTIRVHYQLYLSSKMELSEKLKLPQTYVPDEHKYKDISSEFRKPNSIVQI